jgi:hypothetical protein
MKSRNGASKMKVRLTETIEVDPKSWATEFGIDPKEVREDIKLYFSC